MNCVKFIWTDYSKVLLVKATDRGVLIFTERGAYLMDDKTTDVTRVRADMANPRGEHG